MVFFPKVIKIKFIQIISLVAILLSFVASIKTNAASIDFTPSTQQFISGCTSGVNIDVNATGQDSNAADMEISYNPNEIDIIDSNPDQDGIQIKTGNAYESYIENRVEPTQGKIFLAAVSINSTLSTNKTFGTIYFKNKPGVTSTSFKIRLDGVGEQYTFDSNVADTSTSKDILSSVTNGTYQFVFGYCETEPPKIIFENPIDRQQNVPVDSQVNIKITDNDSGVDIDTVQFNLNGDIYTAKSPEVTYTGDPLAYNFVIKPRNKFYADKESNIQVTALDRAKNKANGQIFFDPPFVCLPDTTVVVNKPTDQNTTVVPPSTVQQESFKGGATGDLTSRPDTAALSALVDYSLLALAFLLFSILDMLLANRHRLVSGFAIDPVTGEPIKFKTIDVYDILTDKIVARRETEKDGKFVFHLLPGNYKLTVDSDDIQWTESILVPEISAIKKMNSNVKEKPGRWDKLAKFYHTARVSLAKLAPGMLLSGFVLSLLSLYVSFSPLNIIITSAYIIIFILVFVLPYIYRKFIKHSLEKIDR
jgi:hypothetical protein